MALLLQFFSYSFITWLTFAAIAFCAARYFPWWCIPVGHIAVAVILFYQDFNYIQSEMRKPGYNGTPDLDIIFIFGLLIRIFLINLTLLPITALGVWLRRRKR